ncbi:hypothetical protein [Streptomyces abikoensis]
MPSTTNGPASLHEALIKEQYGRPLDDLLKELAPSSLAELLQEQRRRAPASTPRRRIPSVPDPRAAEHRAVLAAAITPRRKARPA